LAWSRSVDGSHAKRCRMISYQLEVAVETGGGVEAAGAESDGAAEVGAAVESDGGAETGAADESVGAAESDAGAEEGSVAGAAFDAAFGSAAGGAEEVSGGAESGAGLAESVESAGAVASGGGAASDIAIFSFGITCAMPSSAFSRRGVSSGYFVFHSATSFASGLVSITEKSRIIAGSSMARISSMDWVVPIAV